MIYSFGEFVEIKLLSIKLRILAAIDVINVIVEIYERIRQLRSTKTKAHKLLTEL